MLISLDFDQTKKPVETARVAAPRYSRTRPQPLRNPHSPDHVRNRPHGNRIADTKYRSSSDPKLSVQEALRIILSHTPEPIASHAKVATSIIDSVIAEDVYATGMVPACRSSDVDGYAIVLREDQPRDCVCSIASIASGFHGTPMPLHPGTVMRVAAGDPLPINANAVATMEDTRPDENGKEHVGILMDHLTVGKNVREPGSDIEFGSRLLARGDRISAASGALGSLAMARIQTVKVFDKPRVGIITLGDGDVNPHGQHQEANIIACSSFLSSWGFEAVDLGITHTLVDGEVELDMRTSTDVIVVIDNPSSSGPTLRSTIGSLSGGAFHFQGVSIKSGDSTGFATVSSFSAEAHSQIRNPTLIFSVPSDSRSALVSLNLFVLPALHKLSGEGKEPHAVAKVPWIAPQLGLPRVAVVLTHYFPLDGLYTDYHFGMVTGSRSDARLYATSVTHAPSGARGFLANSAHKANALIILRAGRGVGIKGEIVEALLMGPIQGSDTRLIC